VPHGLGLKRGGGGCCCRILRLKLKYFASLQSGNNKSSLRLFGALDFAHGSNRQILKLEPLQFNCIIRWAATSEYCTPHHNAQATNSDKATNVPRSIHINVGASQFHVVKILISLHIRGTLWPRELHGSFFAAIT